MNTKDKLFSFTEEFIALSDGSLVVFLEHFPTYREAMNFVKSFRPLFENTPEHVRLVNHFTVCVDNKEWFVDGKRHHLKKPAHIRYLSGELFTESWFRFGCYYREDDLPNNIEYMHGKLYSKSWLTLNGIYHREEDKPAYIDYDPNGNVYRKKWYLHNKLYRINGPAEQHFYESGELSKQIWYTDDYVSRIVEYDRDGKIIEDDDYSSDSDALSSSEVLNSFQESCEYSSSEGEIDEELSE